METPLADKFIDDLNEVARNHTIGSVYLGIFAVAGRTNLERDLQYLKTLFEGKDDYFKEAGIENWFGIWHKSIRQTDYFQNCFTERNLPLLSDKERSEYKHLHWIVKQDDFDKRANCEAGKIFNPTYLRYLELHSILIREDKRVSIDGYLDSILWNTIHLDKEDILFETFEKTFKAYEKIN